MDRPDAASGPRGALRRLQSLRGGPWLATFYLPWIPQLGITINLALDGWSLILVALSAVLGIVAVIAAWNEITRHVGLFYFNLLWTLAATIGVFPAMGLFLYFFFWELMIVPMFFLIALWGEEGRAATAPRPGHSADAGLFAAFAVKIPLVPFHR